MRLDRMANEAMRSSLRAQDNKAVCSRSLFVQSVVRIQVTAWKPDYSATVSDHHCVVSNCVVKSGFPVLR